MRKHHNESTRSSDPITGIAEATAERVRLGGEVLIALAEAVARNEKTQRRFRDAVLIRLSKIETIVQMIHGAQIVETQRCIGEKVDEHAKAAEEYISQKSSELGLAMVKYICGESEAVSPPGKRGPKRHVL